MPIFRLKRRSFAEIEAGFSLLEVLVVLAIMGLMLSIVSVRMVSSIESRQFTQTAEAALADIRLLRADAMLRRSDMIVVIDGVTQTESQKAELSTLRRLDVPEDWHVDGPSIRLSASGSCSGGRITFYGPEGRKAVYDLSRPTCKFSRVTD